MSHYYSSHQDSPLHVETLRYQLLGKKFVFSTASGVFSKKKIDKGTLILIESMEIAEKSSVLDIGCGIGILGVVAATCYSAEVTCGDVNLRALSLAKENFEQNNVKAVVKKSNLYDKITKKDFDVVLSNPPQSAGKQVCFDLISGAKQVLKVGGSLQLVARKNKGGKVLSEHMETVFGNLEVLAKSGGYWVYKSIKN